MKEVLKLAISRLEWFIDAYPHDITTSKEDFLRPFKEALAQPEQEPFGYLYEGIESHTRGKTLFLKTPEQRLETRWWREVGPVYTTPPQRTWVGLTDDEIDTWNIVGHETLREFVRAVEAKLKEKNT